MNADPGTDLRLSAHTKTLVPTPPQGLHSFSSRYWNCAFLLGLLFEGESAVRIISSLSLPRRKLAQRLTCTTQVW